MVEDDADVRSSLVEILGELGYRVIEAPNGPGALRQLDAHHEIKLLLTDVGLPGGMNRPATQPTRRCGESQA